jgi:hypothetical protein
MPRDPLMPLEQRLQRRQDSWQISMQFKMHSSVSRTEFKEGEKKLVAICSTLKDDH